MACGMDYQNELLAKLEMTKATARKVAVEGADEEDEAELENGARQGDNLGVGDGSTTTDHED
ncbi:hypothetical protein CK203_100703 [Vitis vinifera]|uniref:Uncharacterized protein n=1 Tax=Vitis vinifera TaxID=29760 RepID=A0A438FI37_VITVI|nr:hypothetical protein CK203_100703 [Vitis vinifera]